MVVVLTPRLPRAVGGGVPRGPVDHVSLGIWQQSPLCHSCPPFTHCWSLHFTCLWRAALLLVPPHRENFTLQAWESCMSFISTHEQRLQFAHLLCVLLARLHSGPHPPDCDPETGADVTPGPGYLGIREATTDISLLDLGPLWGPILDLRVVNKPTVPPLSNAYCALYHL